MVIASKHQNPLLRGGVAAELIKQVVKLIVFQQRDGIFVPGAQAVKRLIQLVRVLLNKAVGDFTNTAIKAVGGIQRAVIPLTKIVIERGSQ